MLGEPQARLGQLVRGALHLGDVARDHDQPEDAPGGVAERIFAREEPPALPVRKAEWLLAVHHRLASAQDLHVVIEIEAPEILGKTEIRHAAADDFVVRAAGEFPVRVVDHHVAAIGVLEDDDVRDAVHQ